MIKSVGAAVATVVAKTQTTKHNCLRGKKDVYRHNFNFQVELDMQYALFIFAFPNEKV